MKLYGWCALSACTLMALTGCGSAGSSSSATSSAAVSYQDGQTATVKSVQSGNTLRVDIDGVTKQVRLLNVVAPSENNNEVSGSCLQAESTQFLTDTLPEGSQVTLQFDDSQIGSSGYLDAAIYLGEEMVNAKVVRAGMAATTYATANDEFYAEISQAQQDAANEGVGLYSADTECSIPHAIREAKAQAESAGEIGDENERASAYREASSTYNSLAEYSQEPAGYAGSIVTLTAVQSQLSDLKTALGANYYDKDGMTAADHASASATATARPGQ